MKVAGLWCRRPHEGRHGEEGRGDVALDIEAARVEDGRLDRVLNKRELLIYFQGFLIVEWANLK